VGKIRKGFFDKRRAKEASKKSVFSKRGFYYRLRIGWVPNPRPGTTLTVKH